MRTPKLHRIAIAVISVAIVIGITPLAAVEGDRLIVLVSPLDAPGPSSLVSFDIGADGLPVQVETYPTGGTGWGQFSPQEIAVDHGGRFLFAANNVSASISAFALEPDGTLQAVPGSPFPVERDGVAYPPVFLALTPDASFLYAVTEGWLMSFRVGDGGTLEAIQSLPLTVAELAVSPAGDRLFAAGRNSGGAHAFDVMDSGMLHEIEGSPFSYDSDRPYGAEVSADGSRLWILDLDTGIATFDVGGDGTLLLSGQTRTDDFAHSLVVPPGDRFVYLGLPFRPQIRGFAADSPAAIELPGSPFTAQYACIDLLASRDGRRVYEVTRELANLLSLAIEPDGTLTPLGAPTDVTTTDGAVPNGAIYLSRVVRVAIDVRPGSDRNPIQPRAMGIVSVVVFGSAELDVEEIDLDSVRFGPGGAIPTHRLPHPERDVDGDGLLDVVLHFRIAAGRIACGDVEVELTGLTVDGRTFAGTDRIEVLGCETARPRVTGGP